MSPLNVSRTQPCLLAIAEFARGLRLTRSRPSTARPRSYYRVCFGESQQCRRPVHCKVRDPEESRSKSHRGTPEEEARAASIGMRSRNRGLGRSRAYRSPTLCPATNGRKSPSDTTIRRARRMKTTQSNEETIGTWLKFGEELGEANGETKQDTSSAVTEEPTISSAHHQLVAAIVHSYQPSLHSRESP